MAKKRRRKRQLHSTGRSRDAEGNSGYVPPQFEVTDDLDGREKLVETIERELPEFAAMVQESPVDLIMLHQDAFAAGYDVKEYILFGMAMKYAGLHGKTVQLIGAPGETC
jgi:hypothetical protein